MDEAAGVTVDIHNCTGAEEARWDDRLNEAYKAVMDSDRFSDNSKSELRDAQRAWIAYREKVCQADGDLLAEGGTAATLIAAGCALSMTAQRTLELEDFIQHQ